MYVAVAAFPKSDGRNVLGPIARLTIATVPTITTSRLMMSTVSQIGNGFARPSHGTVRTTNVLNASSLSAIGSSQAPSVLFWSDHRAVNPSRASVRQAVANTINAHPR